MNTQSRAHRILRPLEAFSEQILPEETPEYKGEESLLGIYRNKSKNNGDHVVFTTVGIHIFRTLQKKWESVRYMDIVSVEAPGAKRCTELSLKLQDGAELVLPICGVKAGRFYDSMEVLRFLDRVIADYGTEANKRMGS